MSIIDPNNYQVSLASQCTTLFLNSVGYNYIVFDKTVIELLYIKIDYG